MGLEDDLKKETEKWLERMEKEMKNLKLLKEDKKDLIENIRAYIKDSKYFLEKGDLVRSFEAIIWAWAWLSILKELGVIK